MKKRILYMLSAIFAVCGCSKETPEPVITEYNNTLVYFAMAYNNLYPNLKTNIDDLCKGDIGDKWSKNAILVFSHSPESSGDYTTVTSPVLYRIYRSATGGSVRDTLVVYPKGTISASTKTVKSVMEYVKENFPAKCTGILLSSHGTGWIESDDPSSPEYRKRLRQTQGGETVRPTFEAFRGENPLTKTIGSQFYISSEYEYSMDIDALAEALPYKVDYILFDACLMGGIETAWTFRNKCDYLVFSPTEILSPGYYIYKDIPTYLFGGSAPDLKGLCKAYYEYYKNEYSSPCATITLVKTSGIQELADACKPVIANHFNAIKAIKDDDIQSFYTGSSVYLRCFCDLRHIFQLAGATSGELSAFDTALSECVVYSAHTDRFLSNPIDHFCGFSMYLPGGYYESTFTDHYKKLSWNTEVSLVK